VKHASIAFVIAGSLLAGSALPATARAQDARALEGAIPPANGVWVDSLDLAQLVGGPRPRPGQAAIRVRSPRGAPPAATPITLGGATFQHGLGVTANSELWIDLRGAARQFQAVVGIDDARKTGRGSVTFEVWVDGKRRYDSGVLRAGDAPRPVAVNLAGARRMILFVGDGGDGGADDVADWGGATLVMARGATTPATMAPPVAPPPAIAAIHNSGPPQLNNPRITGATPGRPFLFRIPASGSGPLTFEATNLPPGLSLDEHTGVITGSLQLAGPTLVTVTVQGQDGKVSGPLTIVGGRHMLALTPPLGWNSWNVWGPRVDDAKVRAAADALVRSGLAAQGYTYVNIDDAWEGPRDANGEITTNAKFPDMRALADFVHSKGLKIGIYSGPGPQTCQGFPASYQHELQDARTWARWGFDYIKYDWCSYSRIEPNRDSLPGLQKPYLVMRAALDSVDRDLVYSLCQYGMGQVWQWGAQVGGNLWRVTGDINDSWGSMSGIGFAQTGHEQYAGPGHWNDTDMLVVGMLGWGDSLRPSRLTADEQITHITLWSLQAAPLLIGADLSQLDAFTTNLLGNNEVLAVDQDQLGRAASRKAVAGRTEVWARKLSDSTLAVGLFNRDLVPQPVTVRWSDLGITGAQPVRDLWLHKNLGSHNGTFTATVPRHGAVLIKIGKPRS
jgi:alpha-galactosidase